MQGVMSKKQKKMLTRIMAAAFGVILLNFVPVTGILRFTLYLAVYLVIGYDILKKAGRGILNRRMFEKPQKYQCINGYPTGLCKCRM